MAQKIREYKPDLSDLPLHSFFARGWRIMEAGYPITKNNALAEGGYTQFEYEDLYEKMYPGWTERWAYWFRFFSAKELEEIEND